MTDVNTQGGFAGDPVAALSVSGTGGCCGNPPQTTLSLPEPAGAAATCCGTAAEAKAENTCCGSAAKADAVATGNGCCG
ncbi:hypothetical protein [Asanoa sp. NPDC050611]|uniref:hypothetical protein n=1 Tax=Asanoa sp. NPDC050611 TaxID=3157098 RepID=UPI00340B26D3